MAIGSERTGSVKKCTACVFTAEFVLTNQKVYFVVNTTYFIKKLLYNKHVEFKEAKK